MRSRSQRPATQSARQPGGAAATSLPVFAWWDYPLFIALSVLAVWAIGLLGTYWFGSGDWRAAPIPLVLVSLFLVVGIAIQQLRWWSLPLMRRPRPVAP